MKVVAAFCVIVLAVLVEARQQMLSPDSTQSKVDNILASDSSGSTGCPKCPPIDVAFVLDTSGSVDTNELSFMTKAAKSARSIALAGHTGSPSRFVLAETYADETSPAVFKGIRTWAATGELVSSSWPKVVKDLAQDTVPCLNNQCDTMRFKPDQIVPRKTATDWFKGFRSAAKTLLKISKPNMHKAIVVMIDGGENVILEKWSRDYYDGKSPATETLSTLIRNAQSQGIRVFVLGIGIDKAMERPKGIYEVCSKITASSSDEDITACGKRGAYLHSNVKEWIKTVATKPESKTKLVQLAKFLAGMSKDIIGQFDFLRDNMASTHQYKTVNTFDEVDAAIKKMMGTICTSAGAIIHFDTDGGKNGVPKVQLTGATEPCSGDFFDCQGERAAFMERLKCCQKDIYIVGHTSSSASGGYNKKLSVARVNHVGKLIREAGIQRDIYKNAFGESRLLKANDGNEAGRAAANNRRVEAFCGKPEDWDSSNQVVDKFTAPLADQSTTSEI